MRSIPCLVFALIVAVATGAFAGPVGVFDVAGTNPSDGSAYKGAVAVERNGATYTVVWRVGDAEYVGTGVGAANVKGFLTFGDAAEEDTTVAVSYVSEASFGLALFVEQENGQWKGIWTYGGSDKIGSETWTPR